MSSLFVEFSDVSKMEVTGLHSFYFKCVMESKSFAGYVNFSEYYA